MSEKERPKPRTGNEPESAGSTESAPATVTGADIEAAVRGLDFPATVRDVLERARRNGADESVVERLEALPDRRFTSLGDTLRALDMLS